MNKESETVYMKGKGIELANYSRPDTLYILAKRIVIKDKEIGIEIDLKAKIKPFIHCEGLGNYTKPEERRKKEWENS